MLRSPVRARLDLLQSLMCESRENSEILEDVKTTSIDITKLFRSGEPASVSPRLSLHSAGTLVVADLTDPILDADDVSRIFRVLLSMFRRTDTNCPKLAVFDDVRCRSLCRELMLFARAGTQVLGDCHAFGDLESRRRHCGGCA